MDFKIMRMNKGELILTNDKRSKSLGYIKIMNFNAAFY